MITHLSVWLSDLGAGADLLIDDVQWCLLIVQNVGGHLGHVGLIQVPADPLHLFQQARLYIYACNGKGKQRLPGRSHKLWVNGLITTPSMHLVFAPTLFPDVKGNSVGLLFGTDQVHIVGNEELASASHRGSPGWHKEGGAEIRSPFITLQLPMRWVRKTC